MDTVRASRAIARSVPRSARHPVALPSNDRLRERAAELPESLAEVAPDIAHDVRNLLQGVLPRLELMLEAAPSSAQADAYRVMVQALADGVELLDYLQDYAAPATGANQRAPDQLVDLNRAVQEAIRFTERRRRDERSADQQIDVELEFDPRVQGLRGSPAEIRSVLINLLLNAFRAMPTGGTITIRTRAAGPSRPEVELVVEDTGEGMDLATLKRVQRRFESTKLTGRSGIGLASSNRIVKRHGGRLFDLELARRGHRDLASLPGCGGAATVGVTADPGGRRPLRVLIVDDNPGSAAILRDITALSGDKPSVCPTATAALAALEAESWDLALVNLSLPDLPGARLAAQVLERWPATRVAIVSGYTDRDLGQFDPARLIAVIAKPTRVGPIRELLDRVRVSLAA